MTQFNMEGQPVGWQSHIVTISSVQNGSGIVLSPDHTSSDTCPICERLYASAKFPSGLIISNSSAPLESQYPNLCFRKDACATQECPDCHWMVPGGRHDQEACQRLKAIRSGEGPKPQEVHHQSGIHRFIMKWDNSLTISRLEQLRHDQVEGTQFSSGHVAIDLPALFGAGTFFESIEQLTSLYQKRGMVIVEWLDGEKK